MDFESSTPGRRIYPVENIDLQVNGYAGVDFNAPGLTMDAVKTVALRPAD